MTRKIGSTVRRTVAASAVAFWLASSAGLAHCDTMDGPVVQDAAAALGAGDVTPVLKWVPQESERAVREAFAKTLTVRTKGQDARELADMYFFETLVRLHRAGEGQPYAGLKAAGEGISPAVQAADKALEQGSVDDLAARIASAVEQGVRQRFAQARDAAEHKDESVQAGRRFVAAYVRFVHLVEHIHQLLEDAEEHHRQSAAGRPSAVGEEATSPAGRGRQ